MIFLEQTSRYLHYTLPTPLAHPRVTVEFTGDGWQTCCLVSVIHLNQQRGNQQILQVFGGFAYRNPKDHADEALGQGLALYRAICGGPASLAALLIRSPELYALYVRGEAAANGD